MASQKKSNECIIEALLILMDKKAYEDITITDIATKAGFTCIPFYHSFNSKEDVLKTYLKIGKITEIMPIIQLSYIKLINNLYSFSFFKFILYKNQ